jgi:DNA mismatch repair protein MutS
MFSAIILKLRNTHKEKVPQQWIRKQTLVNAERYITAELKTYEEKILGAEERILSIETEEFGRVVGAIQEQIRAIQQNAGILAQTDCLLGFATRQGNRNT